MASIASRENRTTSIWLSGLATAARYSAVILSCRLGAFVSLFVSIPCARLEGQIILAADGGGGGLLGLGLRGCGGLLRSGLRGLRRGLWGWLGGAAAAEVDFAGVDVDVYARLTGSVGVEVVAHRAADEDLRASLEVLQHSAAIAVPIDGEPRGALHGGLSGFLCAYVLSVRHAKAGVLLT